MKDDLFLGHGSHGNSQYVPDHVEEKPDHVRHRRRRRKIGRRLRRSRSQEKTLELVCPENLALSGIEFCSRSEAICAELLRRYIPNFELKSGVTFQVPIGRDNHGNTLAVDFLVDGVLVEYHPVRFHRSRRRCGDFRDHDEYESYARIYHALKNEKREFFHDVMEKHLLDNYFRKRRAMLDSHPLFRRTELIVVCNPEDLYHKVIRRFGTSYPSCVMKFRKIFDRLQVELPESGIAVQAEEDSGVE